MVAKAGELARRLQAQHIAGDHVAGSHAYYFSPDGEITGEFTPAPSSRSGIVGHPGAQDELFSQNGDGPGWGGRSIVSALRSVTALPTSQTAGFGYFTTLPTPPGQCPGVPAGQPCPDPPQQEQVKFIGQDQHVYELLFNPASNGWRSSDLTRLTSTAASPTPLATGTLVAFQTSFNRQQHVMFVGVDTHIHELFYDGTVWHHQDLTQLTGSPAVPATARNLTGYQTTFNNQEHVDFISADGHVRELFFDTAWHANDLTVNAAQKTPSTPLALTTSALAGYQTTFNSQHHVDFIDATGGHVFELFIAAGSTQWSVKDLTAAASAPTPDPTTALAGYQTTFNNQQHIDFIAGSGDETGDVIELFFDGTNWHPNDISVASGFAGAAPGIQANRSALVGYQTTYDNQQHVDFISTDSHVRELFQTAGGAWDNNDLSVSSQFAGQNPTLAAGTLALDGYQTTSTTSVNQQHVNFISTPDNHVRELFLNQGGSKTAWQNLDLTDTSEIPWVSATGTWTVPQVNKSLQPANAVSIDVSPFQDGWSTTTWVGIDGSGDDGGLFHSTDVLQAGTEEIILSDGSTHYDAWYEWFVDGAGPTDIVQFRYIEQTGADVPCSPGDVFTATISYVGGQGFIVLANVTAGIMNTFLLDPPPNASFNGRSIEWIAEDNSTSTLAEIVTGSGHRAALANFSPVTFTNATGTDAFGNAGNPDLGQDPAGHHGFTDNIVQPNFFNSPAVPASVQVTQTTTATNQVTVRFVDWHDNDLTAIAGAHAAAGKLISFVSTFNNQQHIVYVGTDNHIYELLFASGATTWTVNDLTTVTGSPLAAAGSSITGYQTTFNNQEHVDFVSADGHVRELWFDTSWHPFDLTVATRQLVGTTPLAMTTSALNGYQTSFNNQQHVDFIDASNHDVMEFWYDTQWHPIDLTLATRIGFPTTPSPIQNTALAGYTTDFNNQQHVIYISGNAHVNELWHQTSEPTTWHWNDLTTAATGAPAALQATPLDGFATTFNNQEHVNFVGPNNNVFELFYNGTLWQVNNLTALSGDPTATAQTRALDGYQTVFNNQAHVNFFSADNHVRELFLNGSQWSSRDLKNVPVSPAASVAGPASKLTGYQSFQTVPPPPNSPSGTPPSMINEQEHVDYVDPTGHIHELIHGP